MFETSGSKVITGPCVSAVDLGAFMSKNNLFNPEISSKISPLLSPFDLKLELFHPLSTLL